MPRPAAGSPPEKEHVRRGSRASGGKPASEGRSPGGERRPRRRRPGRQGRRQAQGEAEGDLTRAPGVSSVQRPSDDSLRKARTNLRSLVSDGPSQLPSLNLVADSVERLELEKRGKVALLYISLDRYGRLEPVFGWRIVAEILDAVAANLEKSMPGAATPCGGSTW